MLDNNQRVVVEKKKRLKKWDIKGKQGYALYEWWLRRIGEVKGGHRYYFMMCMVIYACKCDVPREKLEKDLEMAYEKLQLVQHDNPLTKEDVRSALETYDKEYYNFTIADIEKLTDIHIKRNKRNGRSRKEHLQGEYWIENGQKRVNVCKANRELALQEMRERGEITGRPSAENIIREYMKKHPEARKNEVCAGTGKSKPTVYKYYDRIKQELTGTKPCAENTVREYLLQHPDARKVDVIRGTGLSKPTVYKYYDDLTKK